MPVKAMPRSFPPPWSIEEQACHDGIWRRLYSGDPNSLLNCLLLIVPIGIIALLMWGWQTLAIMLGGTIVVGLLLGAVLEPNPQNRVWSFFTKAGVLLFAGIGFMIVALVSMFIAGLLGVPGW